LASADSLANAITDSADDIYIVVESPTAEIERIDGDAILNVLMSQKRFGSG
jgi:hypothetical protein